MNKEWDLSPLYAGIDTEKFQNDLKVATELVAAYNDFAAALPEDRAVGIRRALELQEKLYSLAGPMFEYCSLRSAVNTSDGEALDAMSRLQKLFSDTSAAEAAVKAYVGRTENLEALIAADPFLGEYAYLLRTTKDDAKYVLDEKVEEALAKMNLSGGDAWEKLQAYLTSTVEADYRGKKLNLSAVRNLLLRPDQGRGLLRSELPEAAGHHRVRAPQGRLSPGDDPPGQPDAEDHPGRHDHGH